MSAAEIAGPVAGPTYLSGNSLGIVRVADLLGAGDSTLDRDADEQALRATNEQASVNEKCFTMTP